MRLGYEAPDFTLQPHLPSIHVGRSREAHLQCLAVTVSRLHLELRRYVRDDKVYWSACDTKSTSRTYVNGHIIPHKQEITLNDRDLISIGENLSVEQATGGKRRFLFRIRAPQSWASTFSTDDDDEEDRLQNAATPPPPVIKEEVEKPKIKQEDEKPKIKHEVEPPVRKIKLNIKRPRILDSDSDEKPPKVRNKRCLDLKIAKMVVPKDAWKATVNRDQHGNYAIKQWHSTIMGSQNLSDVLMQSDDDNEVGPSTLNDGDLVLSETEDVLMIEKPAFSQQAEVIELNSDSEDDYLESSQRWSQQNVVKEEEMEDDLEEGECESEDDVVVLSDDELESSQLPLFERVVSRIKKEKEDSQEDVGPKNEDVGKTSPVLDEDVFSDFSDFNDFDEFKKDEDKISKHPEIEEDLFSGLSDANDELFATDDVDKIQDDPKARPEKFKKKRLSTEEIEQALCNSLASDDFDIEEEPEDKEEEDIVEAEKPPNAGDIQRSVSLDSDLAAQKVDSRRRLSNEEIEQILDHNAEEYPSTSKEKTRKSIIIDPLPMMPRAAFRRGISLETTEKLIEKKSAGEQQQPTTAKTFYGSKSNKKSESSTKEWYNKTGRPDIGSLTKEDKLRIANKRKERLAELAESRHKESAEQEKSRPPVSSRVKIKQSEPKAAKLMKEFDLFQGTQPKKKIAPPKRKRHTSMTTPDKDGNHVVNKLTFDNVVTKIEHKKNKRIHWQVESKLCAIRYIPLEGHGRKLLPGKVNPECLVPPKPVTASPGHTLVDVFLRILNWHPKWLQEQMGQKDAPPVEGVNWPLNHVPGVFADFKDYCKTFYPLMLHELWEAVFRHYMETKDNHTDYMVCVTEAIHDDHFTKLSCYGLLTDVERRKMPSEGWLIHMELRSGSQIRPCFGHIDAVRVYPKSKGFDSNPYVKELEEASILSRRRELAHVLEMSVTVKRQFEAMTSSKPVIFRMVSRVGHQLRYFQAVQDAIKSPLFKSLLIPSLATFYVGTGTNEQPLVESGSRLNNEQKRIMLSGARICTSNMNVPQAALIQGPPGTGKSTTITAMVMQIIARWRKNNPPGAPLPRILITAPSNAAVDELVRKLLAVRSTLPKDKRFNMMRIGKEHVIHQDVRRIRLESLRDQEVAKKITEGTNQNSVRLEIENRQAAINRLGEELAQIYKNKGNESNVHLINRNIAKETQLLQRAKTSMKSWSKKDMDKLRKETTDQLLEHADIVASTLSSSMNGQMEHYYVRKTKRPFSICIMDEASQCVEPEALIPLKLGFTKLVMAGDPEQLPATVSSMKAKGLSYDVSLFTRLFKYFENAKMSNEAGNPIQRLVVQYRMHSEIVEWPNKYFYGALLKSTQQDRTCPLASYKLLNLNTSTEEQIGGNIWNYREALMVARLTQIIKAKLEKCNELKSIGVLTFYAKQRNHLSLELQQRGIKVADDKHNSNEPPSPQSVVVRTVDGFQGSESDIIIMSCVRSQVKKSNATDTRRNRAIGFVADAQRLNVALTRAKFALYIVGNFDVLQANPMWAELITNARARGKLEHVKATSDLSRLIEK